jgi:hypothetical protein
VVFSAAEIISSDEGNPPLLLTHCNKTRDNGFPRCFFSSEHAATACFTGDAYAHEKLANLLAAAAAAADIVITIATSSDIQSLLFGTAPVFGTEETNNLLFSGLLKP